MAKASSTPKAPARRGAVRKAVSTTPAQRPVSPRFAREDWLDLGLEMLAREGPPALTIERLTEAAARTRGSFYHHFPDQQAFLTALGAHWLADATETAIAHIDRTARDRRTTLSRHAADIDHRLEREVRRLAAQEPVIARVVADADARRIAYLVRLFRDELSLSGADALARAQIQHCYFVGAQMVFPGATAAFRKTLQKTLGATLWRR